MALYPPAALGPATMVASMVPVSGRYIGPSAYSTSSTLAASTGRLYLTPFYVPRAVSVDRITINVATLAASTTGRCGLYASNPTTLLPAERLADGGAVSGATTGLKETVIAAALAPGVFYFAFVADGATWAAVSSAMVPNLYGSPTGSLASSAISLFVDQGAGVTTLPATLVGTTLSYSGSTAPVGMVRVV